MTDETDEQGRQDRCPGCGDTVEAHKPGSTCIASRDCLERETVTATSSTGQSQNTPLEIPRFPKDHPAVCYRLCDPDFEVTPHIHTPQGVFLVEVP